MSDRDFLCIGCRRRRAEAARAAVSILADPLAPENEREIAAQVARESVELLALPGPPPVVEAGA